MPHDKNGQKLENGTRVLLRAAVSDVQEQDDYCNVTIKSVYGRRPDKQRETVTLNAAVLEVEQSPGFLEFADTGWLRPGVFCTVHRGSKWMQAYFGEKLEIRRKGEDGQVGGAVVMGKAYLPFELIPEYWLSLNYDPSCRDRVGLAKAMERVYGKFDTTDVVTVLLFEVL
jgi:hypothetical protein